MTPRIGLIASSRDERQVRFHLEASGLQITTLPCDLSVLDAILYVPGEHSQKDVLEDLSAQLTQSQKPAPLLSALCLRPVKPADIYPCKYIVKDTVQF